MKTKVNFKKLLAVIGLIAVGVPSSLNVVACGPSVVKRHPKIDLTGVVFNTYGAYSVNNNGANVDAMKKWVKNLITDNNSFITAVNKIVKDEAKAKDMLNYLIEGIYWEQSATNPIENSDIINDRRFFAKVVGVNQLKGWFAFRFQTTT